MADHQQSQATQLRQVHNRLLTLYPTWRIAKKNPVLKKHIDMQSMEAEIDTLEAKKAALVAQGIPTKSDVVIDVSDEETDAKPVAVAPALPIESVARAALRQLRPRLRLAVDPEELMLARFLVSPDGLRLRAGKMSPNWKGFALKHPERSNTGRRKWYVGSPRRQKRVDRLVSRLRNGAVVGA